jgi:hypothetical protein
VREAGTGGVNYLPLTANIFVTMSKLKLPEMWIFLKKITKKNKKIKILDKRPGRDSNPGQKLRRLLGYPLPYRDNLTIIIVLPPLNICSFPDIRYT